MFPPVCLAVDRVLLLYCNRLAVDRVLLLHCNRLARIAVPHCPQPNG